MLWIAIPEVLRGVKQEVEEGTLFVTHIIPRQNWPRSTEKQETRGEVCKIHPSTATALSGLMSSGGDLLISVLPTELQKRQHQQMKRDTLESEGRIPLAE